MSLHETLEKIRSAPVPTNEETAKFQILAPVLNGLDWDPSGQEVLYEYPVGGKGGGRVDIALDGPQHVVALIEAKAPGQDLNKHVDQVIGYAFHQGVDICVLTTGLEWWLYLPMEKGPPGKRLFLTLDVRKDRIEQLIDDLTTFLGRKNLLDGQASKRAKQVLKARHLADRMNTELPKIWKSMLTGPDEDLVELVRKRAYEKLNLRPARQQAAAVLRNSPVPTVVVPDPGTQKPEPTPPEPAPSGKPTRIQLWGNAYEVMHWIDVLRIVAEALHQRYEAEFDRVLTQRTKRGKPHASRNPDDLHRPTPVGSTGIYLERNLNRNQVQSRARLFLDLFGHPPSDLEVFFDDAADPTLTPQTQIPPETRPSEPRQNRDLTPDSKPTGFLLWGKRYEIRFWKDLVTGVAEALYRRHGGDFGQILTLRGRKHPWASRNPDDIPRAGAEVGPSGIYIDTHFSGADTKRRAIALLEFFGHDSSDLELLYD